MRCLILSTREAFNNIILVARSGAFPFGFMVWRLCFVLLPNYPLYHGEEAEIFMTQFLIQGKERPFEMPPVVHFVLAAEFCTSHVFCISW